MNNLNKIIFIVVLLLSTKLVVAQSDSTDTEKEYKQFFYPNGSLSSEGYLYKGKPDGFWISYYVSGIKKSEGTWKNNQLDSIWIFYNQLKDTTEKINYYLGVKNGYHYKYYTGFEYDNQKKSKDLYVNGKRNGTGYVYYPGGNIRLEIPYVNDKKHGIAFEYDKNQKIITITRYRNNDIIIQEKINRYDEENRKNGTWKEFYEDGTLKKEQTFEHGKLNGLVKLYDLDGKLINAIKYVNGEVDLNAKEFSDNIEIIEKYNEEGILIFQGSYNENTPIGVHRFFNNQGLIIKSETYDIKGNLIAQGIVLPNGNENGEWIYYFENSKIKAKGGYNKGKKTGEWIYYYQNGKVQQKGSYVNGKLTGIWRWFYQTGELLKEEFYIYGRLDGESIEYSQRGEIISHGNYIEGYKEGKWLYIIGDQRMEGNYIMGEKNGTWKSYYREEEELSFEGKYLQGREEGKHVYFYPDGSVKEERYYSEGKKIRAWSKYNENGQLIVVVQYKENLPYKINGEKVKLGQLGTE